MPTKDKGIQEFEFVDAGRKFFCSVEVPGHTGMPPWWWFRPDTETSTRYAPFEASASDTKQSVQKRIIVYYAELLAIAARPVHQRPVWKKPERQTAAGEIIPVLSPVTPPV
jgi:hypothetical protein